MTLSIPSWLTKSYLEKVLKNYFKCDLKVLSFNVAPCNEQGEGFMSVLLRVSIAYEANKKVSSIPIILKCESENELAKLISGPSGFDLQKTEMNFFEGPAEEMLKIFQILDGNSKVIPEIIFVDKSRRIFMMEDLRVLNFTMANRLIGLDEKHVKISLQKLAKYHSASLKILSENPKAFESFDVGLISRKVPQVFVFYGCGFKASTDEISSWKGFEKIGEKMRKLSETFMEKTLQCYDVDEDDFNVLCHGDLWTTNLMFKYDGEELKDAVLIDFQFTHYVSAAIDLFHFFFSSLNDEIFTPSKVEEFCQFYFFEMKSNLEKLNLKIEKISSLHKFTIEYHKKLFYAFVFMVTVFPIMISDDPDNKFETHNSSDEASNEFRRRIVKSPRFRLACERFLPYFDRMGVLDL